jgi:hypothetical protein
VLQYFEQHSLLVWQSFLFSVHAVFSAHSVPSLVHCWLSHGAWLHAHLDMSVSQWHAVYSIPLEQYCDVHWYVTFLLSHFLVAALQYPEQQAVSLSHAMPIALHCSSQTPVLGLQESPLQQLSALPAVADAVHISPTP